MANRMLNIRDTVENELVQDEFSVLRLTNPAEFSYSDGTGSETYLHRVLKESNDLTSRSAELESHIKDWTSEYHLSPKRAQLLSGFTFDRDLRVLEVGCGCGAITRFLGENFDSVISVEGNITRARLARQRTRDLNSVSIINAPFQVLKFRQKIDLVFCIGVYEYSAAFIKGDDPYHSALKCFSECLTADGLMMMAIENQFGLKYFNSSSEDHLGKMFMGLEGYHRNPGVARTFGKTELERMVKEFFPQIAFYYPYPDYKVPDCVLSSEFLASGLAGELVSQMRSRDYSKPARNLWNEYATILELNRNGMLDFFSNSFLILAGRNTLERVMFDQLGILFSSGRKPAYTSQSRILKDSAGRTRILKRRVVQTAAFVQETRLKLIDTESVWHDANSLLTVVTLRLLSDEQSIRGVFEPCKRWIEMLTRESILKEGVRWIDGSHIDSLWGNMYLNGEECRITDREWIWHDKVRMNTIVIRAIYDFLCRIEADGVQAKCLSGHRGKSVIQRIARSLGVCVTEEDFDEFIRIEPEISWIVTGRRASVEKAYVKWFLYHRPTRAYFRRTKPIVKHYWSLAETRITNLLFLHRLFRRNS
jgi:SAM-dependent methyltransferase